MKEYLTSQTADVSVADIEDMLVGFGITNLTKEYENHTLQAITFILPVEGRNIPFRLPVNITAIEELLKLEIRKPKSGSQYFQKLREEAEKIAWHIISDWIDLQITLVKLGQTELMGVMMPFAWDATERETMYEKVKATGFEGMPKLISK